MSSSRLINRNVVAGRGRTSMRLEPELWELLLDTYSDADRFFSFRRATHRREADYGRQLSAIAIPG